MTEYNEYLVKRRRLFEDTVVDMVEHIVEELINDPEGELVDVKYEVGEKDASLVILIPEDDLPLVLGNSNKDLLAAIKKIAFRVANQYGFYLELSVEGY